MFTEVLIASFFIQLLALVTPLFFQVVIDKVLVHRGLSTLDVLMVGLGVITIFEVLLTGCAPTCSTIRPTGLTLNSVPACSGWCAGNDVLTGGA